MCDKKASKINYGNCLHLSSGTHFMTLSCATRLFNQHITFLPCKGWKKYPSRKPKRHDNLDILREKRRRHKVQTKRETFQQAIKYILDAFCESFAAGLWRCNFLNVSDVAVLQRCHPLQLLSSHSTSILIAKYGDNFKEVKDIDAP